GLYSGLAVWLGGLAGLLSFGALDGLRWFDMNLFAWILAVVTNVVLPVVALSYCLFVGRVLSQQHLFEVWRSTPASTTCRAGFLVWHGLLRYPTRLALIVVLLYSLGGVAFVRWLWG